MRLLYTYCVFLLTALLSVGCEKNQPPTCNFTSPSDGSEFHTGEIIIISVDADDPDGNVTEVRLFVDDVFVGLFSASPYSYEWNTEDEEDRLHTIKATIRDNEGATTELEIFVTLKTYLTFTDSRDENTYKTICLGDHIWMAENLAYLPSVSSSLEGSFTDPYYYVYGYDDFSTSEAKATDNYNTYGVIYNWPAAIEVCPAGWHLPSDEEWKDLEIALGMTRIQVDNQGARGSNEGSKLAGKADLWSDGYLEYDTEFGTSGFTALPGGLRNHSGTFYYMGYLGYFWSGTDIDASSAWIRSLGYSHSKVERRNYNKEYGLTVRCVKD